MFALFTPPFVMMALANFFTVSSFATFYLLPLFVTHHGGSQTDIGVIMGAFPLASVLCRPFIAEMVDRLGRKRSFTVGSGLMCVLPLSYLSLEGPLNGFLPLLLALRVLHGVGLAACLTAAFTFVADIVPADRLNEGIGIFGVSGLIGLAFGPVTAEWTLMRFDFNAFFIVGAILAAAGMACHLPAPESLAGRGSQPATSFFALFKRRKIVAVALLSFLFGIGVAASANFVSPFVQGQALGFVSLYYVAYSLAAVIVRIAGGGYVDRVGEHRIIPPALVLTALGLFALDFAAGNIVLALAGFMFGCGHGLLYPCLNALAVRNEPMGMRGKITASFTGSIDAGSFLGSILLGCLGDWAGFRVLFLAAGSALLLGLAVFRWWGKCETCSSRP